MPISFFLLFLFSGVSSQLDVWLFICWSIVVSNAHQIYICKVSVASSKLWFSMLAKISEDKNEGKISNVKMNSNKIFFWLYFVLCARLNNDGKRKPYCGHGLWSHGFGLQFTIFVDCRFREFPHFLAVNTSKNVSVKPLLLSETLERLRCCWQWVFPQSSTHCMIIW